jgi:hypothetical protein
MLCLIIVSLLFAGVIGAPAQAGHRLGGGVEYLKTLGDIKDTEEFDSNAFGFLGSYQYSAGLFKIEGDVEWVPDFGGSSKSLFQPQAYVLIGGLIYGGAGIGTGYIDGDWWSDPFYALRAGVDFTLGGLDLDAFALYRFQDVEYLEGFGKSDLDSITFGAVVRFGLGK